MYLLYPSSFDGIVTYAENQGLTVNKGHFYEMRTPIDPSEDLIFMSYRNGDRAILKGIRLRVEIGVKKQTQIIELFNSKSGIAKNKKLLLRQATHTSQFWPMVEFLLLDSL